MYALIARADIPVAPEEPSSGSVNVGAIVGGVVGGLGEHSLKRQAIPAAQRCATLPCAPRLKVHCQIDASPFCAPFFATVVLALLAFFALRPGKGWLRRAPPRTDAAPVYSSPKQTLVSIKSGSLPDLSTGEPPLAPGPALPKAALLSVQTAGEESGSLPLSYITTGGPTASPATTRWVLGAAAAAVGWPMMGTGQANAWVA